MIVVDTPVWVEYLERLNPLIQDELVSLLRRDQVATAGMVVAELRRGVRSQTQLKTILDALEPLAYFEVDRDDVAEGRRTFGGGRESRLSARDR